MRKLRLGTTKVSVIDKKLGGLKTGPWDTLSSKINGYHKFCGRWMQRKLASSWLKQFLH